MNKQFFWKQIEKDLFIISSDGLEDFRAVFGAKTSRSISVEEKWNIEYDQVQDFLLKNLMQYGHASIGDMSFISVFHRGFGWLTAWLLEDDPLFNGQEVSTRAVNIIKTFPSACYDSVHNNIHDRFAEIFCSLSADSGSYKYDRCRWAIPGSVQTGVTIMMTARSFIRHMEKILNIDFASETAKKYLLGAQNCAPALFTSLHKRQRIAPKRWNLFIEETDKDHCITISAPDNIQTKIDNANIEENFCSRKERNTYLPEELNQIGLFKVEIICSIAAARDWHRHRSVMPWQISLVTKNRMPFISSFYNSLIDIKHRNEVDCLLQEGMEIINKNNNLQSLYVLPFGASVKLTCYASINYLVYMLELRAFASGSNKEYSEIAVQGLQQLRQILGNKFCNYFAITSE